MPQPVIEIENVDFSYDGAAVLQDVTLQVAERDFACLVGPNGGGKTTLLRLVLGLLKPTAGRVRVFGAAPEAARPRIGYMPQHAAVDPRFPVSVADVVLMGRVGRAETVGPYRRRHREAAGKALREVGLYDLHDRAFGSLSGGQRQRTLIARALAAEPELLLLDEPTANLDAQAESGLYELLNRLNERLTIVMVSHDLGFVSSFVKSVICVKRCVVVHPTSAVTGEIIQKIYGGDVCMIRHDQRFAEGGHDSAGGGHACQSS
jgi:zinc transport system ATP-binding protein